MDLEKIKEMSIEDVDARLTEIRSLDIDNMKEEEVSKFTKEVDALKERRKALRDEEEQRKRIEAEQNSSNLGALIGVAVGLLTPQDEIETEDFEMKLDM